MKNICLTHKTILVTGSAGFIGAALIERLLSLDIPLRLIGIDDLNDYYDPALKAFRMSSSIKPWNHRRDATGPSSKAPSQTKG